MNLVACVIVKDEEEVIDRLLDNLADGLDAGVLSHVCVVDTGSSDSTREKVLARATQRKNISLHQIEWKDSFAEARNAAINMAPKADLVYMPDADDMMDFDWSDVGEGIAKGYAIGKRCFGFPYVLSVDAKGASTMTLTRQSVFDPSRYRYVGRAHECLDGPFGAEYVYLPGMKVVHDPKKKDGPGDQKRRYYASLLRKQVEETPNDPRWNFYFGRELAIVGEHDEAVDVLGRYIPMSKFQQEKTDARIYRASSLVALGRATEAEGELFRAWFEDPKNREPLFVMAEHLYASKSWGPLVTICELLLGIPYNAMTGYGQRRDTSTWKIYDYLCIGCYYSGDIAKSVVYGRHALEYRPTDERLIDNVRRCEETACR